MGAVVVAVVVEAVLAAALPATLQRARGAVGVGVGVDRAVAGIAGAGVSAAAAAAAGGIFEGDSGGWSCNTSTDFNGRDPSLPPTANSLFWYTATPGPGRVGTRWFACMHRMEIESGKDGGGDRGVGVIVDSTRRWSVLWIKWAAVVSAVTSVHGVAAYTRNGTHMPTCGI